MDTYVLLILLLLPLGAGLLATWSKDLNLKRQDSALARIVGAAARAAGRINDTLAEMPIGASREAVRQAAIASAVRDIRREFGQSLARVGGTDDKVAGIIAGELGRLPQMVPPMPDADRLREAIRAEITRTVPVGVLTDEAREEVLGRVVDRFGPGRVVTVPGPAAA